MNDRIKKIREFFCNNSNLEFAERMGEKPNTVSNWMNRTVKMDVLEKILKKFPEINTNWLLTGEGDMLKENKAGIYQNVEGSGNNVVGSGNLHLKGQISTQEYIFEIESLKAEIEHLKQLLEGKDSIIAAKDQTIQILLGIPKDNLNQ